MTTTLPEVVVAEPRHWTSSPLLAAGDTISSWAAGLLADAAYDADGLYVATTDAGARESIAFWSAARETGLAFAAPGAFPWTLAVGPSGAIAKALGIRGPNLTLLGEDAWPDALDAARHDVAARVVRRALVVGLTSADPLLSGSAAPLAWFLSATVVTPA